MAQYKVEVVINEQKVIKRFYKINSSIYIFDPPFRRYQKDGQNWLIWP